MVQPEYIVKLLKNRKYNHIITTYYEQLKNEPDFNNFINIDNKVDTIHDCNRFWLLDVYERNKVKDFIKTNFCKDKFCSTCKKAKQANRTYKFVPELEKYEDNLYHLVLTVPDVFGEDLKKTLSKMFISFQKLIRYLSLRAKLKDVDIDYKFKGAIRSLEITFNNKTELYHPHLHCAVVFEDNPVEKKENINKFSFSNRTDKITKFSDFEILVQKIWYLINNNITVNKSNIDSCNKDQMYSCLINKFGIGDYAEMFKYMIKEVDEEHKVLSYDVFKTLVYVLHRARQIQGYGCFYGIKFNDDEVDEEDKELIHKLLQLDEKPIRRAEKLSDLFQDHKYVLVTKKVKYKILQDELLNESERK